RLSRRSVVTIAGSLTLSVASPLSTSRTTSALFPSAATWTAGVLAFSASLSSESTLEAKVAWLHPSHSARYWPVWFWSSSMLCLPSMARSGFSRWMTALSSAAADIGSSGPEWFTQTALVAPMARACRSCSWTSLPPMLTTTSSPPCFATRRRPSSTAISSKGLILYLSPSCTMPEPSAFTLIFDSGSSTRLAVTRIFTARLPPSLRLRLTQRDRRPGSIYASTSRSATRFEPRTGWFDDQRSLLPGRSRVGAPRRLRAARRTRGAGHPRAAGTGRSAERGVRPRGRLRERPAGGRPGGCGLPRPRGRRLAGAGGGSPEPRPARAVRGPEPAHRNGARRTRRTPRGGCRGVHRARAELLGLACRDRRG